MVIKKDVDIYVCVSLGEANIGYLEHIMAFLPLSESGKEISKDGQSLSAVCI